MTGRTVEEAIEAALEQLGVAETDAEIVIVEEPKSGMFGLRRSGARIRARVRPVQPRAKRPSRRPRAAPVGGERGRRRQAAHPEEPGPQVEREDRERGSSRQSCHELCSRNNPSSIPPRSRARSERFAKPRARAAHKPRKRRMRVLTSVALRQQVVGNVRVRGARRSWTSGERLGWNRRWNLRVKPVVALDRLRRRR